MRALSREGIVALWLCTCSQLVFKAVTGGCPEMESVDTPVFTITHKGVQGGGRMMYVVHSPEEAAHACSLKLLS